VFDLERDDVTGHYWKGLNSLRSAFSEGEPLAKHPGVGPKIAEWLLQRGLIETVENPRYRTFGPCYRVSKLGDAVIERGQRAKPAPRPKLKMLEPRIHTVEVSTTKKPRR